MPSRRRRRCRQVIRSRRISGTACPAETVGNGVSAGRPGGPDSGPPPGDGDSPAPSDQRDCPRWASVQVSPVVLIRHDRGGPVPARQGASLRPPRASEQSRGNGLLRIVDRRPVDLDRVEVEQSVLVCTEASNVEAVGTAHGSADTLTRSQWVNPFRSPILFRSTIHQRDTFAWQYRRRSARSGRRPRRHFLSPPGRLRAARPAWGRSRPGSPEWRRSRPRSVRPPCLPRCARTGSSCSGRLAHGEGDGFAGAGPKVP